MEEMKDISQPNDEKSYTKQYQKHTPSGFNYYIKCFDEKVYFQDPVKYTKQSEDEDIAQTFLEMLEKDITWIYKNSGKVKIKITLKEQKKFQKATKCWICKEDHDRKLEKVLNNAREINLKLNRNKVQIGLS